MGTLAAHGSDRPLELSVACIADDDVRRDGVGFDYDDHDWHDVAGARPLALRSPRSPTATAR
jgi:hypothetical protein